MENLTFYKGEDSLEADFCILETKGDVTIKNLIRNKEKDTRPYIPTVKVKNLPGHSVTLNGNTYHSKGESSYFYGEQYDIIIHR